MAFRTDRLACPALGLVFALGGCSNPAEQPAAQKAPPPEPVKITQFYASPANPPLGEKTLVCYGVENAAAVEIDPPVEKLHPAQSHCFEIVPKGKTVYKLTARRGAESVSKDLTIEPGAPLVKLLEVSINALEIKLGDEAVVCYKAKNAADATIRPGNWMMHRPDAGCVSDHPQKTTTYVITATGAGGDTVSQEVTAKVK